MTEECPVCGGAFATGIDGVERCKRGHEKKRQVKHYTYPLSDEGYKKSAF